MEDYPINGNKCEYCMRCVSMCSLGAIKFIFTFKGKTYSAVKAKYFLKKEI
jgi:ferredoxin